MVAVAVDSSAIADTTLNTFSTEFLSTSAHQRPSISGEFPLFIRIFIRSAARHLVHPNAFFYYHGTKPVHVSFKAVSIN